ncbi:hypothetical protein ACWCSH_44685, partial [Streptosporangium sp. NPDC001682]
DADHDLLLALAELVERATRGVRQPRHVTDCEGARKAGRPVPARPWPSAQRRSEQGDSFERYFS